MTVRSDLSNDVCLQTILANARAWYRRSFPRNYVRDKDTAKHMTAGLKRELDKLFAQQNGEWDGALMAWYERMVTRYGGELKALPWASLIL